MKSITKLFAFGDSFVMGSGLEANPNNVSYLSWPFILGEKLKVEYTGNYGIAGGSNKRTVYKFFLTLPDILKCDPTQTLVIFSWTGIARTCLYDDKVGDYFNMLPEFHDKKNDRIKIKEFYYAYVHREVDAVMNFYVQMNTIATYLNHLNVKWFFVRSFNEIHDIVRSPRFPKAFHSLVPKDKFFLGWDNSIQEQICRNEGLICPDQYHPSESGHARIAELMTYYMKKEKMLDA